MIAITRSIEGISINGKEWLLNEDGEVLKFKKETSAINFLKQNGFDELFNVDFYDLFFFEEVE